MARSRRPLWVLLLGLLISSGVWPAVPVGMESAPGYVDPAPQAIDDCVRRLNPDVDIGYDRIVARCPTLVRRLQDSGVLVWLPRDWQRSGNDLSVGGLRELRGLLSHELRVLAPPGAARPDIQHVMGILASLGRADDEHNGWWARTRAWLRSVFAGADETMDGGWLTRMIGQSGLSQTVLELISYVALALVVVLALAIVANELRVGRLWAGRSARRRMGPSGGVTGDGMASGGFRLGWEDIPRAPVAQRLGLLLELVIARLSESGGLRLSRGLTTREVLRAAPLADEKDRERLAVLARAAERMRFGGTAMSETEVAAVMREGRGLLEHLEAGAGARTGAAP